MSSREFAEWLAFFQLEPFGPWRDDYRAGIVAATTANCAMGREGKALGPEDFVPTFGPRDEKEAVQRQLNQAAMITALLGGTDRRRQ